MEVRLSALRAGHPLPPERFWYSFLLEAIVQLEGLGQLKNPMTSLGIEPATFRQKGWEINMGEKSEADKDTKGTK
jgi:hypothetical protein